MSNIQLSDYVNRMKPSITLALNTRAAALRASGKTIYNLTTGEPNFDTPDFIKDGAIEAIQKGQTKYTPVDGTPTLKKAIQQKLLKDNGLDYNAKQIMVSCGAKQTLFNACLALLNPGDEAIIPAPYWVSYPEMVNITGAKPVFVTTTLDNQYKMTPEQLREAITPKTKLLILNSPNNPTGKCYQKNELAALAKVLLDHPDITILSDDIYEHILWQTEPFANIVMACPQLYDRTLVINGVSKAYAMTGWRIGYAAGHERIIQAMKTIQSHSTSNPCSIAQAAAENALTGDQRDITTMVKAFKNHHNITYKNLSQIEGIHILPADGTFYSFPNIQAIIDQSDRIQSDIEFAEYLLNEAGVAVVPGSAFGDAGAIRLSYATDTKTLEMALSSLKKAIDQLR